MPEERVLDVKNLKIDFHTYAGEVKAIRNVSFHLNKGETLAIVGESGSGKSVTTRSIIGLLARNAQIE
ncbi:MAG: ATP-binding cassette domain-containing protein, partial [Lactobacillus crispatus]|nr:ATP-binding cassette domain-containing protein [Lactobacillus crispatus]